MNNFTNKCVPNLMFSIVCIVITLLVIFSSHGEDYELHHGNAQSALTSPYKTSNEIGDLDVSRSAGSIVLQASEFIQQNRNPCWLEDDAQILESEVPAVCSQRGYFAPAGGLARYCFWAAKSNSAQVEIDDDINTDVSHRVRCVPSIYLAGVAKSGTVDLSTCLLSHPSILGHPFELFWWNQLRFLNTTLDDYAELFTEFTNTMLSSGKKDMLLLDYTSVLFTENNHWMQNQPDSNLSELIVLTSNAIFHTAPHSKFIVMFRNPATRLFSHYTMFRRSKGSPKEFHQKVLGSIDWWRKCVELMRLPLRRCLYGSPPEMPPMPLYQGDRNAYWGRTNYSKELRNGMYSLFVKDWFNVFPPENLLFIKSEEYSINKTSILQKQVFPFLGLKKLSKHTMNKFANTRKHSRTYTQQMLPETLLLLNEFYRPFNEELATLLKDDKWKWDT